MAEIYLINEWDGEKWVKRQMLDGQSVIIRDYDDPELGNLKYHEFILVKEDDGSEVLKDTVALLEKEIDEELRELGSDIHEVANRTTALETGLAEETSARTAADTALNDYIDRVNQKVIDYSAGLIEVVANVAMNSANTQHLSGEVITEIAERKAADADLQDQIDRNKVIEDDGTVKLEVTNEGTKVRAHVDGKTITFDSGGEMKSNVTLVEVTEGLDPDIAHAYELHYRVSDVETVKIIGSDRINVAKDKFIKDVRLSNMNATVTEDGIIHDGPESDAALVFSFIKSDGTYELVKVNVAEFLQDVSYGDGLAVSNGVVSVKKSPDSEAFLSVDADGVRVTGIQNAINAAIATVNASIAELGLTVSDNQADIATLESNLDDEIANREAADTALEAKVNAISASVTTNKVVAGNGITVAEGENTTVSVKLNNSSNALSVNAEGLLSNLSLSYADDKINLLSNGSVIASIDTTGFTKDKLIKSVDLYTVAEADSTVPAPYIKIVWKTTTGDDITRIPLEGLVDVYQAGNGIDLQNNVFSVKVDPATQPYLTVGAAGVKLSGLENVAIGNVVTSVSPAEAADQSLVRIIDGSGRFYVSNSASDIKYNSASVATTLEGILANVATLQTTVANLQAQLASANTKIDQLEAALAEVTGNNLKTKIVDTMARTITGYPQQIGIKLVNSLDQETSDTSEVDKIKIKFAADAEFVADNI